MDPTILIIEVHVAKSISDPLEQILEKLSEQQQHLVAISAKTGQQQEHPTAINAKIDQQQEHLAAQQKLFAELWQHTNNKSQNCGKGANSRSQNCGKCTKNKSQNYARRSSILFHSKYRKKSDSKFVLCNESWEHRKLCWKTRKQHWRNRRKPGEVEWRPHTVIDQTSDGIRHVALLDGKPSAFKIPPFNGTGS